MVDSQTEGQEVDISSVAKDGKAPRIIGEEKKIGEGDRAVISEATVIMGDNTDVMVIKRFKDVAGISAEEGAARAMRNYKAAINAGLKVFPKYILGEDKQSIWMTPGNTDKDVCIGSIHNRSPQVEEVLGRKIEAIADEDFDELVDGVLSQAVIGGNHNITFESDAFFFLVDRETGSKVDFVVGDLDEVQANVPLNPEVDIDKNLSTAIKIDMNLACSQSAIEQFITHNVNDPDQYIRKVRQVSKNIRTENVKY